MMKSLRKSIPVWILLQALVLTVAAQDSSRLSFYVKAGFNTSNMAGSSAVNDAISGENPLNPLDFYTEQGGGRKLRLGWQGGAGLDLKLGKQLGVLAELNFDAMGSAAQVNDYYPPNASQNTLIPVDGRAVYALDYITIPVLFKYYFRKLHRMYIDAGMYYGYLVSGNEKDSFKSSDGKEKYSLKTLDYYNRADLGYSFGAGYEWPLAQYGKLFIDLRFERSLSTLGSKKENQNYYELYNQSMAISAGYKIPF